jgi:Xaa-Pro dipeptidase
MHAAAVDRVDAARRSCRPGASLKEVFNTWRDAAGDADRGHEFDILGHGLGGAHSPTWIDWPIIHAHSEAEVVPNMVLFLHSMNIDAEAGLVMSIGETVHVTETGSATLSRLNHDLVIRE